MKVVRQIPKVSEKKNYKTLERAIERKVKCVESFQIKDNILYIVLSRSKAYDEGFRLVLPSYKDIYDEAIRVYKNFKGEDIFKVCYSFRYDEFNKKLNIEPNFCDVEFLNCRLYDLNVFGGDSIKIIGTKFYSGSIIKINCQELELNDVVLNNCDRFNVISNETNVDSSKLKTVGNINITSPIMVFNDTKLEGQNIELKCDLIDTKNSIFKSEFQFNIKCRYNEEVSGIDLNTESIIYNGVDITNTDSIKRPQLLKTLIEDLKKIKDFVDNDIKSDIEETVRIRRESLEEKPITKILNKNNR